jgi:CubicO group peptidase (beta-lactamase class C family)
MPPPTVIEHSRLPAGALERLHTLAAQNVGTLCTAMSIAVWHRDSLVLDAAWGWQGEMAAPLTHTDLRFDLASLTKLFTATAFLKLLSDSSLSLESPITAVIPEFGASGPRPITGGWDPHTGEPLPLEAGAIGGLVDPTTVTFRHLLTHTGGLVPWRALYELTGPVPPPPTEPDPVDQQTRMERGLAAIYDTPFAGQPGGTVRYSDLGLILLGEAARRLFTAEDVPVQSEKPPITNHQSLTTPIHTLALRPAGLASMGFNPMRDGGLTLDQIAPTEVDQRWRKRRAWGEVHDENACGLGGVAGHAGLFGAVVDVAAFGQAWLAGAEVFGLPPELVAQAITEQAVTGLERRGLGWMLKSAQGSSAGQYFSPQSFGHTGFTGTSLWIDPQAQLVVALLTNSVYPGRLMPGTVELRRAVHDALWQGLAT